VASGAPAAGAFLGPAGVEKERPLPPKSNVIKMPCEQEGGRGRGLSFFTY